MRRPVCRWRALALTVLLAGLAAARPVAVRAATDTVTDCTSESNLRSVISSAAAHDTVTFACSGTITLTSTRGGAIVLSKDLTIDGSGQAVTISGGHLVGVFVVNTGVTATLNHITIANGYARGTAAGGGVLNYGTLAVIDSTFSGSFAAFGGGIDNNGSLTVSGSTFSGNKAGTGGGILNGGTLTVTNSTFSGNSTVGHATYKAGNGGGISNSAGSMTITSSTFSGNSAGRGGRGGGIANDSSARNVVANTIVADSVGGDCAALQPLVDGGGNLADDATCGFSATSVVSSTALNLGILADNGGPTETIALLPGSAAIHSATCLQTADQRGKPRPGNAMATCDAGAYEYQGAAAKRG